MNNNFLEKHKFTLLLIFTIVVFITTITLLKPREKYSYDTTFMYEVQEGDTLYDLAKSTNKNLDVYKVINIIIIENGLVNNTIYDGQMLEIPIFNNTK